ncbi:MAG: ribosome recycling factor [Myxococcota bacterium]|jgi:ribosome recycling factor|nr:ribosome recycling factor [Myxococcota bacterium]MEC9389996.1 ribosome recycling factor [Myxococcota bacterium]
MTDEYLDAMADDFEKVIGHLKKELATIRTGRATPQLLENINVTVASYGSSMPLNQLASITAPDARMLVVNAWDKSTLADIERAIQSARLGLNPSNDGQIIRVPVPALTGERRQELVKKCGAFCEEARIRGRSVRKEYNDAFKAMENDKEITEDELKRLMELVQKATDANMASLSEIAEAKEKEVLDV